MAAGLVWYIKFLMLKSPEEYKQPKDFSIMLSEEENVLKEGKKKIYKLKVGRLTILTLIALTSFVISYAFYPSL